MAYNHQTSVLHPTRYTIEGDQQTWQKSDFSITLFQSDSVDCIPTLFPYFLTISHKLVHNRNYAADRYSKNKQDSD